jgi:hypothetical protein
VKANKTIMKFSVIFAIVLASIGSLKSQTVHVINCRFIVSNVYTCDLNGARLPDDDGIEIVIEGSHQPGRSNDDVLRVDVANFNDIPFIVTQFFTKFPNLGNMGIFVSGLRRIQPNAFANARNLTRFSLYDNMLRSVPASAFIGASNLDYLSLSYNTIENVDETAFAGLSTLRSLFLERNRIQQLPTNVFAPLTSLEHLNLSINQLTSLDGRIFANNHQLRNFDSYSNRINAVGRNIFDGLERLFIVDLTSNVCVSQRWILTGNTTVETVRGDMVRCFGN